MSIFIPKNHCYEYALQELLSWLESKSDRFKKPFQIKSEVRI